MGELIAAEAPGEGLRGTNRSRRHPRARRHPHNLALLPERLHEHHLLHRQHLRERHRRPEQRAVLHAERVVLRELLRGEVREGVRPEHLPLEAQGAAEVRGDGAVVASEDLHADAEALDAVENLLHGKGNRWSQTTRSA